MKMFTQTNDIWGECPTNQNEAILWIEKAARNCYRSEDRIVEGSGITFVNNIIKHGHWSVLEHSNMVIRSLHKVNNPQNFFSPFRSKYLHFAMKDDFLYIAGNFRAWMEELNLPNIAELYEFQDSQNNSFIITAPDEIPPELRAVTVKFRTDRAISHELVRHRPCAFCLSGETEIRTFTGANLYTIKELYNIFNTPNSRTQYYLQKFTRIRTQTNSGDIAPAKILSVTASGKKEVFEVTASNGYKIKASKDHIFFTELGEKKLKNIKIGEKVLLNTKAVEFINFSAEVVSIEPKGIEETYDLEVDHPAHNFCAEGFIVHNSQESQRYCSYSKELEIILPWQYENLPIKYSDNPSSILQSVKNLTPEQKVQVDCFLIWKRVIGITERTYRYLLKHERAEQARSILPNCTATRIVVTAYIPEWKHIFNLRTNKAAYPGIRNLINPIKETLFFKKLLGNL